MVTKKELSLVLSLLENVEGGAELEQYQTPSEIAADALWMVNLWKDVCGKRIGDFGCGNGVLGCGALLLGAKHVVFLDVDGESLEVAKRNVKFLEGKTGEKFSCEFLRKDVVEFRGRVDCVIENPPFGVQQEHADRDFLDAGMKSKVLYSFHKIETKEFVERFVKGKGKEGNLLKVYDFPLWRSKDFHKKRVSYVKVGFWRVS